MIISNRVHDQRVQTHTKERMSSAKTKHNKTSCQTGFARGLEARKRRSGSAAARWGSRTKYLVTIVSNYSCTALTEKIGKRKKKTKKSKPDDDDAGTCQAGGLEWLLQGFQCVPPI